MDLQEAKKKPWHNSRLSYQNIILKPTPSYRPKTFWMIIKSLSKQSSNIPMLSYDDSLVTSDYDKENCLKNNNFNHSYQFQSLIPISITQLFLSKGLPFVLSNDTIGSVGGHTTVVVFAAHEYVAIHSPVGGPRVLDDVVVVTIEGPISDG